MRRQAGDCVRGTEMIPGIKRLRREFIYLALATQLFPLGHAKTVAADDEQFYRGFPVVSCDLHKQRSQLRCHAPLLLLHLLTHLKLTAGQTMLMPVWVAIARSCRERTSVSTCSVIMANIFGCQFSKARGRRSRTRRATSRCNA